MKFLNNVNFNRNQLLNAVAQILGTDPGAPSTGQFWYNSTDEVLRYYDGNETIDLVKIDKAFVDALNVDAATLGGQTLAYILSRANHTGEQAISTITGLQSALDGKIATSEKGAANGVATLGADSKVPTSQLPDAALGGLDFQGIWNADTNTPTIQSGVGERGQYYKVSVAGSTEIDGRSDWDVGDWIIFSGTEWQKIDSSESVSSVNGKIGEVVLDAEDVGALAVAANLGDLDDVEAARGNLGLGTAATYNVPASGDAASNEVVLGNDSRLVGGAGLNKHAEVIGNGTNTSFTITHNFGTRDVDVIVFENSSPYERVFTTVQHSTVNSVTLLFAVAPATDAYRVVVMG